MSITVGNSVLGLYNLVYMCYYRYMAEDEHPSIGILDELVRKVQELGDLYMHNQDENPGAEVETHIQREQLDALFQALGRFIVAETNALDAVAKYFAGLNAVSGVEDFSDGDF